MNAAFTAGCRKFDGSLLGFGGCPMAKDELVGNMPTENMIQFVEDLNPARWINKQKLMEALHMAKKLYVGT
jgi:hydroxymethylglutaryl-CoA lyase